MGKLTLFCSFFFQVSFMAGLLEDSWVLNPASVFDLVQYQMSQNFWKTPWCIERARVRKMGLSVTMRLSVTSRRPQKGLGLPEVSG